MPTRTRLDYDATRLWRWILQDVGRELRLARVHAGLRQQDVATRAGTSRGRVCRIEAGRVRGLNLQQVTRLGAAVGLKPYVKLFPLGPRLLDAPQIASLARFRRRLHPTWTWATEVPIPIAGDLRSADCVISIPDCRVVVEAYTRLSDFQAQSARAAQKKRDLAAHRLVVLLAATHANRRAARQLGGVADGSFPLTTKRALAALAAGVDPGADAIVFV